MSMPQFKRRDISQRPDAGRLARVPIGLVACIIAAALTGCNDRSDSEPADLAVQEVDDWVHPTISGPWFEEQSEAMGILFVHDSGHDERYLMPEGICGGAALIDIENDGDLDVYLVQSGLIGTPNPPDVGNRLFRNDGGGHFMDITSIAGVGDTGYGMGAACGDFDNDGFTDLYVTNLGPNVMYRNNGDGTFTDVTVETATGHPGWGTSAAFLDFDADNDLDLFVVNYLNWSLEIEQDCFNTSGALDYCLPANYKAPAMDVLYRNDGNGRFVDISESAGLASFYGPGLGIACADFSGDGRIDVLVANDGQRDQLWINHGNGQFRDEAVMRGCAYDLDGVAKAGMGVAAGDVDEDGDTDALICNLRNESDSYFLNEGAYFQDNTVLGGLGVASRAYTRFGIGWLDFDNDSDLDLYQANGKVERFGAAPHDDPYAEINLLLRNDGTGRFVEVLPRGGTEQALIATSRAAAFGDIDNDGGIDVVVVNRDGPVHILRNQAAGAGNWVGFRVVDEQGRDALNALVTAEVGPRSLMREVRAGYSYLASNDPRVHFGLRGQQSIKNITVRWIDGSTERFGDLQSGRYYTLRRGEGRPE